MTKKHNMSKGERFEVTEKKVQNLEMSQRLTQMLLQQIGNSVSPMARDVGELAGRQRDLQYRLLAVQEILNLDLNEINARSEVLQVRDFNEASDKEDADKGYTVADVVTEDSVIIVTSKTDDGKGGFLRSKLVLKEIGFPQLCKDLVGKTVGDVVVADINGVNHVLTVLGIRNVPAPVVQLAPAPEEIAAPEIATPESVVNGTAE